MANTRSFDGRELRRWCREGMYCEFENWIKAGNPISTGGPKELSPLVLASAKGKDLVNRLEEAEKQHEFYTRLYRQYSADLVKMALYVRKVITTPAVADYLNTHHETTLQELSAIALDTPINATTDGVETL